MVKAALLSAGQLAQKVNIECGVHIRVQGMQRWVAQPSLVLRVF